MRGGTRPSRARSTGEIRQGCKLQHRLRYQRKVQVTATTQILGIEEAPLISPLDQSQDLRCNFNAMILPLLQLDLDHQLV